MRKPLLRTPLVAALLAMAALAACGSNERAPKGTNGQAPKGAEEAGGTVPGGAVTSGSCVERYSPENLAKRGFAFDGTLERVTARGSEQDEVQLVTFKVNRWYRGGTDAEVTLEGYGFGEPTSAGSVSSEPGTRMLVTGDGRSVWMCGFTQAWSASEAARWQSAFR